MLRRAGVMIMVLCVSFAVLPCAIAFADDGYGGSGGGDFSYKVVYGPTSPTIASTTKQVQVYAPNNFEAALIVLGYGNDSRVTDDVKAYLSNQSTGGTFYDFAQGFINNKNDGWGAVMTFQDIGMSAALFSNNRLYGAENVWSSEYDMTMYEGAKQRVEAILNGEISGGGGSTTPMPDDGSFVQIPLSIYDATIYSFPSVDTINYANTDSGNYCYNLGSTPYYLPVYASGNASRHAADDFSISISKELYNRLITEMQSLGWTDACIKVSFDYGSSNNRYYIGFRICHKEKLSKYIDKNGNFVAWNYPDDTEYYNVTLSNNYVSKPNTYPDSVMELPNVLKFTGTYRYKTLYTFTGFTSTPNIMWNTYATSTAIFDNDGVISDPSTPTVPPTNWPENPTVTPTVPPEVPEPTSPTIPTQPPEPVNPTSPTYPTIVYEPDVTYVNADLSAVLDAMNAHCKHLQDALHRECSNLWTNVSTLVSNQFSTTRNFLHTQFDWLIDSIDEEFDDFELYLKTLFEWLAEQMSFTFTDGGYDDNTVVSWLKKIYSKLGTGTTTRPVDPTVDPFGIWDWLTRLFADFISNLMAIGTNQLADVTEAVEDLVHKFPFSIPWDIAALLGLLVSPAVTPQFDIPQYAVTSNGLSQVGTYSINLQDYNAVWDGVRLIEKIGFVIFLAWNTTHFLDIFNKGGSKVTS